MRTQPAYSKLLCAQECRCVREREGERERERERDYDIHTCLNAAVVLQARGLVSSIVVMYKYICKCIHMYIYTHLFIDR